MFDSSTRVLSDNIFEGVSLSSLSGCKLNPELVWKQPLRDVSQDDEEPGSWRGEMHAALPLDGPIPGIHSLSQIPEVAGPLVSRRRDNELDKEGREAARHNVSPQR